MRHLKTTLATLLGAIAITSLAGATNVKSVTKPNSYTTTVEYKNGTIVEYSPFVDWGAKRVFQSKTSPSGLIKSVFSWKGHKSGPLAGKTLVGATTTYNPKTGMTTIERPLAGTSSRTVQLASGLEPGLELYEALVGSGKAIAVKAR